MSEIAERYSRIAAAMTDRIAQIGDDQWKVPTPCTDWDVQGLVTHVIGVHGMVIKTLHTAEGHGEDDEAGDDDVAEADTTELANQWDVASEAVSAALNDPHRAGTRISGMFGEQPFETMVSRLLCADTLMHTWDLARATNQDETLDADGVTRAAEFLAPIDNDIRRPGGFAEKLDPPADADAQTKLLYFCGRPA